MVPTNYYLILGAVLFAIGALGVVIRRNAIMIFLSIELMLNAANLSLVALSRQLAVHRGVQEFISGQIVALIVIAVAAAEVAVGLAIIVSIFRHRATVNVDELNLMRW